MRAFANWIGATRFHPLRAPTDQTPRRRPAGHAAVAAYFTVQTHDMRATFWTIGSLILIYLTGHTLVVALAT